MTDAPRYRLVGYDIGTAPDENGGWVHWTDHEVIVARLTAERDAALAGAFCMGRDAAADRYSAGGGLQGDYPMWDFFGDAEKAILALPPPADLAAKIGGAE